MYKQKKPACPKCGYLYRPGQTLTTQERLAQYTVKSRASRHTVENKAKEASRTYCTCREPNISNFWNIFK